VNAARAAGSKLLPEESTESKIQKTKKKIAMASKQLLMNQAKNVFSLNKAARRIDRYLRNIVRIWCKRYWNDSDMAEEKFCSCCRSTMRSRTPTAIMGKPEN
jgi:hypothetical protein